MSGNTLSALRVVVLGGTSVDSAIYPTSTSHGDPPLALANQEQPHGSAHPQPGVPNPPRFRLFHSLYYGLQTPHGLVALVVTLVVWSYVADRVP